MTAASRERERIGARQSEFDEAKHKRDATGKFTFKEGGNSGSSRGRISGRRRESGASFGERAYRRAAEREAEAAAEKAKKKSSGGGSRLTDEERAKRDAEKKQKAAEREAEKKRKEAEREAERKKREAERAERELQKAAERRISNPDQSGGSSGGSRSGQSNGPGVDDPRVEGVITPAMQRAMTDAARGIKVTGADNVTDAEKAYFAGDEEYRKAHAATLPLKGGDREEFLDVIRSRYSPVRIKIFEDGSGWFLDNTGLLWKF